MEGNTHYHQLTKSLDVMLCHIFNLRLPAVNYVVTENERSHFFDCFVIHNGTIDMFNWILNKSNSNYKVNLMYRV